ncbi:MAG: DUF4097 family beta strand repeat-containing protein [Mucilaginibacter sp.]
MSRSIKIIVIALLALIAFKPAKCQDKKEMTVKLTEPAKAGKLDVEIFNGTINVVGYSGTDVIVSYKGIYYPINSNQNPGNIDAKDASKKDSNLDVSQADNVVKIVVEKPRIVDLVIKVPRNFSVVLKNLTAGDIKVANVNGDHEISMAAGNITMSNISGSVSAHTNKGNIKVDMNSVKKGTPLAFSNVGGIIEVGLPLTLKANVKLQTEFGKANSEFDVEPKSSAGNLITGKINGGGAEILMKSIGGDIYLRKTK